MDEYPTLKAINDRIYSGKLKILNEVIGACDRNWFEEYKHHYCHNPYCKPYATRVELGDEKGSDMGFVNVRCSPPFRIQKIYSELSESYLEPPEELMDSNKCFIKCLGTYEEYGRSVKCVPYIMPEGTLNVCAQASIWICLKIIEELSGQLVASKDMPSIQGMATGAPSSDGYGLSPKSIKRILQFNGCGAFYYNSAETPLTDKELTDMIYAYVESGLPVLLGVDVSKLSWWDGHSPGYHAIVLIGHTMDEEGNIDGFILHDESMFPYLRITKDELLRGWRAVDEDNIMREAVMIVPPLVLVPFETANNISVGCIASLVHLKIPHLEYQMRPMLWVDQMLPHNISHFFEGNRLAQLIIHGLNERKEVPDYVWAFILHSTGVRRLEEKADGIVLVDAATNPQLVLLSTPQISIMVSPENKVYHLSFDKEEKPKAEFLGELHSP